MLIKRVRAGTECAIWEVQCGFRQGRGCMDQVFAVRQVCEKYMQMGNVYSGRLLRVYGVGGKLLKAVQSFYVDSRACVRK